MINLVYSYYENPGMLKRQIANWNAYSPVARAGYNVILVDDGSPTPAAPAMCACALPCGVWRIHEDIPWNWCGARNLGAHVAPEGWMLMTDQDILLPPESADRLLLELPRLNAGRYHTFNREVQDGRHKPHVGTFLFTRRLFWRCGGMDEDYSGHYGGGEGPFITALTRIARGTRLDDSMMLKADLGGSSIVSRKTRDQGRVVRQLIREKRETGDVIPHNPLRFTWERAL